MSLSFQERFKNRANFVGRQGQIDLVCTSEITKPNTNQTFSINPPYPNYLPQPIVPHSKLKPDTALEPEPKKQQIRKQTHSAKPFRDQKQHIKSVASPSQNTTYSEDFVPYTIKDYQAIKSEKYYKLGGLGPSNIGTDDWLARKELAEKKMSFAKKVKIANANLPPSGYKKKTEVEKEISKFEKAKIFAMGIPKPKVKTVSRENPISVSVLDELEKQHLEYKASVDAIKSEYAGCF